MSAYDHLMGQGRLPDGFGVRVDPRVRTYSDGRVLIGGSPTRMLKLAPTAAAMIGDGFLEVTDSQSALVARKLLDSGVANPRPMSIPSPRDVTVVVPLKNNAAGLSRLLPALHGLNVIVVDDGSDDPVKAPPMAWSIGGVTVLRHETSRGPAAAIIIIIDCIFDHFSLSKSPKRHANLVDQHNHGWSTRAKPWRRARRLRRAQKTTTQN